MTDYLGHIASRIVAATPAVRPRLTPFAADAPAPMIATHDAENTPSHTQRDAPTVNAFAPRAANTPSHAAAQRTPVASQPSRSRIISPEIHAPSSAMPAARIDANVRTEVLQPRSRTHVIQEQQGTASAPRAARIEIDKNNIARAVTGKTPTRVNAQTEKTPAQTPRLPSASSTSTPTREERAAMLHIEEHPSRSTVAQAAQSRPAPTVRDIDHTPIAEATYDAMPRVLERAVGTRLIASRIDMPSPRPSEKKSAPEIHVTIGRVEVRAFTAPGPTPRAERPAEERSSLDAYLKRRRGETQ